MTTMQAPEVLRSAVAKCPFLHRVSAEQGEQFALQLASSPLQKAVPRTTVLEAGPSFDAAVKAFHGPGGVVPLKRFAEEGRGSGGGCPFHHQQLQQQPPALRSEPAVPTPPAGPRPAVVTVQPFRPVPMASLGLSAFNFLPDPGEFFRSGRPRSKKPSSAKKKPGQLQPGGGGGPAQEGGSGTKPGPNSASSANATTAPSNGVRGAGAGPAPSSSGGAKSGAAAGGATRAAAGSTSGQCPMRRFFGPLGGLLPLSAAGHLQCPSAIIKMRAAVAALKPVRELRPQALPVRMLAMGATAVVANVPCGVWREHTRKFSPEWFIAVHATIPFVAMLRKAVLMPKWAILLTILGSVAGQQVGAKLERARLARAQLRPGAGATAPAKGGPDSTHMYGSLEETLGMDKGGDGRTGDILGGRGRGPVGWRCRPQGMASGPQELLQLGWAPAVGVTPVAAA